MVQDYQHLHNNLYQLAMMVITKLTEINDGGWIYCGFATCGHSVMRI